MCVLYARLEAQLRMLVQQQEGGLVQPIGYTSSLKKHKKQYGANYEFKELHPLSMYICLILHSPLASLHCQMVYGNSRLRHTASLDHDQVSTMLMQMHSQELLLHSQKLHNK